MNKEVGSATLRLREAERLLQSVEEIYRRAVKELERASKEGKPMLLRDSCEKGWLAVVEATNVLFLKKGLGPAESHGDRREKLWKLEAEDVTLRALGIYDRVNARAFSLHIQGFYEGALDEESIKRELEKVRRYIDDIKKLSIRNFERRRPKLKTSAGKVIREMRDEREARIPGFQQHREEVH